MDARKIKDFRHEVMQKIIPSIQFAPGVEPEQVEGAIQACLLAAAGLMAERHGLTADQIEPLMNAMYFGASDWWDNFKGRN